MITELTEAEFIDKFGEGAYHSIAYSAMIKLKESPEYKNGKPYCHSLMAFPWDDYGYKTLIIEVNCKKINTGIGFVRDFGIVKCSLSQEDCPDELLDRYNEIFKTKNK